MPHSVLMALGLTFLACGCRPAPSQSQHLSATFEQPPSAAVATSTGPVPSSPSLTAKSLEQRMTALNLREELYQIIDCGDSTLVWLHLDGGCAIVIPNSKS